MEFHDPPPLTHDQAEEVLGAALEQADEPHDPNEVLVGLALHDPDAEFVERWCIAIGADSPDPWLRVTAALSIGHLARRFGAVSDEARDLVRSIASDEDLDGRRLDALKDVEQYSA